jgi:hypothetical protein
MFHVQIRRFPHNACRFNMTDQELRTHVLDPWLSGEEVHLADRRWRATEATLTIVDGPRVGADVLTMGRGWRHVQREGADVTATLLAQAPVSGAATDMGERAKPGDAPGVAIDSLALELLEALTTGDQPLAAAWRLAATFTPTASAPESMQLADRAVRRLLDGGLVTLRPGQPATAPTPDPAAILTSPASWGPDPPDAAWLHRL